MKKLWVITIVSLLLFGLGVESGFSFSDEVKNPQDVLKSTDLNRLTKSLEKYFKENDLLKKEKLLDKFRDQLKRTEKSNKLDSLLKYPSFFGDLINGTISFRRSGFLKGKLNKVSNELAVRGKKYKNEYALWLPKSYESRQSWPLIVCLHPPGETGATYFAKTWENSELAESCAFLCPTLQYDSWTSTEGKVQILALSLKDVWETYNLDRTRFFLDGSGDGAQQVLTLASWYADIFAGVIVRSTTAPDNFFYQNFLHLPVALLVGADDAANKGMMKEMESLFHEAGQKDSKVFEVPGAGGGHLGDGSDLIKDWVLEKRLVQYPKEITWSSSDRAYGRAYWLEILRQEIGDDLVSSVRAKYDRENNRIEIISNENTLSLKVHLNDVMLDMAKPFAVASNDSEAWKGKKERSLEKLLKSYWKKGDATRLFTNDLEIDLGK